jgi:ABC-type histidine transport system ATPase subunit
MAETPNNTLIVQDIHKSFGPVEVLRGISLTAKEHDVISILGASGSGKSTFLRCINLLEMPTSGSIHLHGDHIEIVKDAKGNSKPKSQRQVEHMRTKLGMVFQQFNLWTHMTVLENVMEGPVTVLKQSKVEVKERAEAILARVGLSERKNFYPSGLSGGQQQRVAIARALCMEPDVLLFDEPTSALDPELVGEVLLVMRKLAEEGRTMIVVTHEMGFARDVSTDVVFLHKGQIEEQGPPQQLFKDQKSDRFRQFLSKVR